ncbi:MAG TPA: hypothetical protein VGS28_03445 [Candidatus Saccharimonadales bacterium]|nr:hypothetical protein [Candidatus Saccharimonadales bacterium]
MPNIKPAISKTKRRRLPIGWLAAAVAAMMILVIVAGWLYYRHSPVKPVIHVGQTSHCPAGYVNYGMPLGCITQQKYNQCMSQPGKCPL